MTKGRRFPKHFKAWRRRNPAPYQRLTLDDSGSDELLDDWMAACPAAELLPPG
jgi:hypothetical protein